MPLQRESFKPGRVVWAKVEGHDWWPAKVVRRRAGKAAAGAGGGIALCSSFQLSRDLLDGGAG